MSKSCNGIGCSGALDCDNCRQTNGCNIRTYCDHCNEEIYETYYHIDGEDICEDCLKELYERSVD